MSTMTAVARNAYRNVAAANLAVMAARNARTTSRNARDGFCDETWDWVSMGITLLCRVHHTPCFSCDFELFTRHLPPGIFGNQKNITHVKKARHVRHVDLVGFT